MMRQLNLNEMEMVSGGGTRTSKDHEDTIIATATQTDGWGSAASEFDPFAFANSSFYDFGGIESGDFGGGSGSSPSQDENTQDCEPNAPQRSGFASHSDHAQFLIDEAYEGRSLRNGDGGMLLGAALMDALDPGCPGMPTVRYGN